MTIYNFINTELLDQAAVARFRAVRPVSDASLALGLVMPSGDNNGNRAKTGAFKREGITSFEHGARFAWRDGGSVYGTSNAELAVNDEYVCFGQSKANSNHDRKLNNIRSCHRQGLTKAYCNGVALPPHWGSARGAIAVTLTDAGLAWVKQNAPALYNDAKAYSSTAYERLLKQAAKPKKAKAQVEPVDGEPVEAVDDTTVETEMPVEVESSPVDIQPPVDGDFSAVEVS